MIFYCNQVHFLHDGMGYRQSHLTSPAIVTLLFYWEGKHQSLHQGPPSSVRTATSSGTASPSCRVFLHFPQAHPGKAHCQPWVGFLWPSEVAARSTPGPYILSLFPGLLDASALHTGNHRAQQQPRAGCRSPWERSPGFRNVSGTMLGCYIQDL